MIGALQRELQELRAACEHSERSVMGLGEHVAWYCDERRSLGEQVADIRAEKGRAHAENAELRRVIAEIDARQKFSPAAALTPMEHKFLDEQAQEVRAMKKNWRLVVRKWRQGERR